MIFEKILTNAPSPSKIKSHTLLAGRLYRVETLESKDWSLEYIGAHCFKENGFLIFLGPNWINVLPLDYRNIEVFSFVECSPGETFTFTLTQEEE